MFIKRIELYGFKSFADKCVIELFSELSVIVGPNGCGKSNVVEAIRWALGAQNAKTMRADKMASVIFNGSEKRAPLNVAQVTLVVSNEDKLLPLEFSEVAIKRRVYRDGTSEYFINDAQVSLKELRSIFYDTGISISDYLVLEQGKIDQVLLAKPDERRKILEEAAGISKFRVSREEGQQRLEKVHTNITQLEQLAHEVEQRCNALKQQAEKAKKYKDLQEAIFQCNVALSSQQYKMFEKEQEIYQLKTEECKRKKQEAEKKLQELIENDEQLDTQLKKDERIIYSYQSTLLEKQTEKRVLKEYLQSLENNQAEHDTHIVQFAKQLDIQSARMKGIQESIASHKKSKTQKERLIKNAKLQIAQLKNRKKDCEMRTAFSESKKKHLMKKEVESKEKITGLQKKLHELVNILAEEVDKHISAGHSFPIQQKLQKQVHQELQRLLHKAESLSTKIKDTALAQKPIESKQLLQKTDDMYECVKKALDDFVQFCSLLPNFLYDFMKEGGVLSNKHIIDKRIQDEQGFLRKNTKELSIVNESLLKCNTEHASILESLQNHSIQIDSYNQALQYSTEQLTHSSEDEMQSSIIFESIKAQHTRERKLLSSLALKKEKLHVKLKSIEEQEKKIGKQIESSQSKLGSQNKNLLSFKNKISKQEDTIAVLREAEYEAQSNYDKLSMKMQLLEENFYSAYGVQLVSYFDTKRTGQASTEQNAKQELRQKIETYKAELKDLGGVNLLAAEEFREVDERREFLHNQLQDLKESQDNLQKVLHDIQTESEKKLRKAYNDLRKEFKSLFNIIMDGGNADITFDDDSNILQSGLTIIARPGNKKTNMLSQLSGGERAMTAIIFIFALYMVKPAPFCVLDEIDAPLDDSNIDRFMQLLQKYVQKIQFLIISHNKRSIVHAKNIIGISMEEVGVSSLINVRVDNKTSVGKE